MAAAEAPTASPSPASDGEVSLMTTDQCARMRDIAYRSSVLMHCMPWSEKTELNQLIDLFKAQTPERQKLLKEWYDVQKEAEKTKKEDILELVGATKAFLDNDEKKIEAKMWWWAYILMGRRASAETDAGMARFLRFKVKNVGLGSGKRHGVFILFRQGEDIQKFIYCYLKKLKISKY